MHAVPKAAPSLHPPRSSASHVMQRLFTRARRSSITLMSSPHRAHKHTYAGPSVHFLVRSHRRHGQQAPCSAAGLESLRCSRPARRRVQQARA